MLLLFLKQSMGCILGSYFKPKSDNAANKPQFSWEIREQNLINAKDFTVEECQGKTVIRNPGTVNGQQFIIQNCEDCSIYVLDYVNTATIDDCQRCSIFIGPTQGSVFIRDCVDCRVSVISQQLRVRDCKSLHLSLLCPTQPSIESSIDVRLSCLQFNYNELKEQFEAAKLNPYENQWYNVHDFTPGTPRKNWSLCKRAPPVLLNIEVPGSLNLSESETHSYIPKTYGLNYKDTQETACVIFPVESDDVIRTCIARMKSSTDGHHTPLLLRTTQATLDNSAGNESLPWKPGERVVALQYGGRGIFDCCRHVVRTLTDPTRFAVTTDPRIIERLFDDVQCFS